MEMYSLETLVLVGNPICYSCSALTKIENNGGLIKKTLQSYFNGKNVNFINPADSLPLV